MLTGAAHQRARAQGCAPEWLPAAQDVPGVDSLANSVLNWDPDGDGPEPALLIIAGQQAAAGRVSTNGISAYDGANWSALGKGLRLTSGFFSVNTAAAYDPDDAGPERALLIAGGRFDTAGDVPALNIASWDGQAWAAMGPGLDETVSAMQAWDTDGPGPKRTTLFVTGNFSAAGAVPSPKIATWNGQQWVAPPTTLGFGGAALSGPFAMTLWDPDGPSGPQKEGIVFGGAFLTANGITVTRLARYDGATWSGVGASGGANSTVRALTTYDPDGPGPLIPRLVVAGDFTNVGGIAAARIASFDGTTWRPFSTGMSSFNDYLTSVLSWDRDGPGPQLPQLFAAGSFSSAGGSQISGVAQWNGAAWIGVGAYPAINQVFGLGVWDRDGAGPIAPVLAAAGLFSRAGARPASNVALWDGAAWTPPGTGMDWEVQASATWDPDGTGPLADRLIVSGRFTEAGGVPAAGIAQWDGRSWQALGAGLSGTDPFVQELALAMTSWDRDGAGPQPPVLIATGDFTIAGGQPARQIASWNGSSWAPLGGGLTTAGFGSGNALTTWDPDGPGIQNDVLVAGGSFANAGLLSVGYWNGTSWTAMGAGLAGTVYALAVWDPDGAGALLPRVVAGGYFSSSGTTTLNKVAQWTGSSWQPMGLGTFAPTDTVVALAVWDADDAGPGTADVYAGSTTNQVYRWTGSSWVTVGPAFDGFVYGLMTWDEDGAGPGNSKLIALGTFNNVGGVRAAGVSVWNGSAWQALGSTQISYPAFVNTAVSWDPDGSGPTLPWLTLGGLFQNLSGKPSPYIARWGRASATWVSAGSGTYSTASRWVCNTAPGVFDRLYFDADAAGYTPGAYTVTLPSGTGAVLADSMRVRTDAVTLNLRGRDLVLGSPTGIDDAGLMVGETPGRAASLVVRNTLATPASLVTKALVVGASPTSSLLVQGLTVQDAATILTNQGALYVGRRANGAEFNLQGGASATVSGTVSVASEPGAVGAINVRGNGTAGDVALQTGVGSTPVTIADAGTGTLLVNGAARMDSFASGVTIGALPGSIGQVYLSEPQTRWTIECDRLIVGRAGAALLDISGGAQLDSSTNEEVVVGQFKASHATARIRGTGSRWIERLQAITVGDGARLELSAGGKVEAISLNILSGGTLVGNGTVGGSSLRISTNTFNLGTIDPTLVDPVSGAPVPGPATLTIMGDYQQFGPAPGSGVPDSGVTRLTLHNQSGLPAPDTLQIQGSAVLGGGLVVEREPALTGVLNTPVELISATGPLSGFFDVALLPPTGSAATFFSARTSAVRGMTSVSLSVQPLGPGINADPTGIGPLPGAPSAAVSADLDGVNGPDVAITIPDPSDPLGQPGSVLILYNAGTSGQTWNGWIGSVQYPTGRNPRAIAAADVDGVNGPDLIIADAGDDTISVLRSGFARGGATDGGGNSEAGEPGGFGDAGAARGSGFLPRTVFAVGDEPRGVIAVDLDGDGNPDVGSANASAGTVSLLRNLGSQSDSWLGLGQSPGNERVDIETDPTLGEGARPVALADARLFGLGPRDIVVANEGGSSITVLVNSGGRAWNGTFSAGLPAPTGEPPSGVVSVDIDDDKWDDIATPSTGGTTISVVLNKADGSGRALRPAVALPAGESPASLTAIDLDADGDEDLALIAGEGAGRTVRVLRNDAPAQGTVTLSPATSFNAGDDPQLLVSANVNPGIDGRKDLVVLGGSAASLARGTGVAESRVLLSAPPEPCPGDGDGNRRVNFADITSVILNFGNVYGPNGGAGDADGNGRVNFADITAVLLNFNNVCA